VRGKLGATEFLGYDTESAEGQVLAILRDGTTVDSAKAGDEIQVIANQTPFYGESGGQLGDTGIMFSAGGAELRVTDTQKKLGDLIVHFGTLVHDGLALGEAVEMKVDGGRRAGLRGHHSATHLLHEALRRRLGAHVTQKGSLVAPDRLRFDISHPKPVTSDDLRAVEAEVNARIRINAPVETRSMTPDEAIEAGALALFGEKYGEEVRVVSMGGDDAEHAGQAFSTELCGGTHVRRAGDIGFLKILSEGALASGVRRIEAVTGAAALDHVNRQEATLAAAAAALKAAPAELAERVTALVDERKRLDRELGEARRKLAAGGGAGTEAGREAPREVAGIQYVPRLLEGLPPKDLKPMVDDIKKQIGSGVVALVSVTEGKASLVVGVTADLTAKFSAVDLVRAGSAALGGKGGGGRPDMAQAGGPDGAKADAALDAIENAIAG